MGHAGKKEGLPGGLWSSGGWLPVLTLYSFTLSDCCRGGGEAAAAVPMEGCGWWSCASAGD